MRSHARGFGVRSHARGFGVRNLARGFGVRNHAWGALKKRAQINSVSGSNIFYGCQKLKEIHVGRIEDIKSFKHDNNPFTASFDLYVGGTLYNTDITIQKECKSAVEIDWIIFCKSIRRRKSVCYCFY